MRIHILHHAAEHEIYGVWMMEELTHHGYKVGPGTLYPMLHTMEEEGWLESISRKTEQGKIRKYYKITKRGRAVLNEAKRKMQELVNEVLFDRKIKKK